MSLIILTVTLVLFSVQVHAEFTTAESRLVNSWGLEFDGQGLLKFNSKNRSRYELKRWQPDISGYLANTDLPEEQRVSPVVISAHPVIENSD